MSLLGSGSSVPRIFSVDPHRVLFDGFLTGRDDGFEAKWFSIGVPARMGFSYGKLPNGEPEKVKPYVSLMDFEGMADFRFARFQFQPHVCEPCGGNGVRFLDAFFARMQDHEIVGVPYDLGFILVSVGRRRLLSSSPCSAMLAKSG